MMRSRLFLVLAFRGRSLGRVPAVPGWPRRGRPAPDAVASKRVQTLRGTARRSARCWSRMRARSTTGTSPGSSSCGAKDAEFIGGGGNNAKGPVAIRDLLQGLHEDAAPTPGRDFHLVMNQTVDVTGDTASGIQPRHLGLDQRREAAAGLDRRQLLRPVRQRRRALEVQASIRSAARRPPRADRASPLEP